MAYILKTYDGEKPMYFYKMCRWVYQNKQIPAFRDDIEDALIFDSKAEAYYTMADIARNYPEVDLQLEKIKEVYRLRGEDGYVPLEKTAAAMCSDDFRERIWAEYEQLNTRRHELKEYRKRLSKGGNPKHLELLDKQINDMHDYMMDLLNRCNFEGIDLDEVEKEIEKKH